MLCGVTSLYTTLYSHKPASSKLVPLSLTLPSNLAHSVKHAKQEGSHGNEDNTCAAV